MLYTFGITFAIVAGIILTPVILSIGAAVFLEVIERYENWKRNWNR